MTLREYLQQPPPITKATIARLAGVSYDSLNAYVKGIGVSEDWHGKEKIKEVLKEIANDINQIE